MLSIHIDIDKLLKNVFETYQEAIVYLASNTIATYRGTELRPDGKEAPSFDISQVCCHVSEQPLSNGMYLCTRKNDGNEIRLIRELETNPNLETSNDDLGMQIEQPSPDDSLYASIDEVHPSDLLLISGDCGKGLKTSLLLFFEVSNSEHKLIENPYSSMQEDFVKDPLNFKHYIWPNQQYYWDNTIKVVSDDPKGSGTRYTSQQCFVYTKKNALVEQQVSESENDSSQTLKVDSTTLEEYVFVEPNPALPKPLYIMAQNTIRLFRLNSWHYQHRRQDYHHLAYNTSQNEILYDDMRLAGRRHAHALARQALNQRKNLRALSLSQAEIAPFTEQHKILMELSGYRSVWGAVFSEGNDPGGFNDILGVPAPVVVPTPGSSPAKDVPQETKQGTKRKREIHLANDIKGIKEDVLSSVYITSPQTSQGLSDSDVYSVRESSLESVISNSDVEPLENGGLQKKRRVDVASSVYPRLSPDHADMANTRFNSAAMIVV